MQKNFGFFEIYGISARQGGEREREDLSRYGYFADKERGVIFRDFARMSFMYGPFHFFKINFYALCCTCGEFAIKFVTMTPQII